MPTSCRSHDANMSADAQDRKFHPAKCLPESRRSGRPSRAFVANADSIRQHRRTVHRGTTWLRVCSAESPQYTEEIAGRARRDQQRLTLRESHVQWVLWGAAPY